MGTDEVVDEVAAGLCLLQQARRANEVVDLGALVPTRKLEFAAGLQTEIEKLRVLLARVLAEADREGATRGTRSRSAADDVAKRTGSSKGDLRGQTELGKALEDHPELDDALRNGRVSAASAKAVKGALSSAPAGADKQGLLDQLEGLGPGEARQRADLWLRDQRRDAGETDDERTRRRFERRGVFATAAEDGMVTTTVILPELQSRQFLTALDHVAGRPSEDDPRTHAQRRADGLIALIEAYAHGTVVGGARERPTIIVTIAAAAMAGLTNDPGWTAHGDPIPADQIRHLAENAIIKRIVMDEGVPLDVGRGVRLATKEQFEALVARDGGCRYDPHCTIPAAWCEADHLHEWELGGPTDLDNLALACSYHHHWRHSSGAVAIGDANDLRFRLRDGSIVDCPPRRRRPAAAA